MLRIGWLLKELTDVRLCSKFSSPSEDKQEDSSSLNV